MLDLFERSEREIAVDLLHSATAIYTAEPVVAQILDTLDWPRGDRRLVDTSSGDGAFLVAALQRLLRANPSIDDAHLTHVLEGWEIHFHAVAEARSRLAAVLIDAGRDPGAARALAAIILREGDFLTDAPTTRSYDVITGNPPYLRYAHLPEHFRRIYEATQPDYAQADILHSFLARSVEVLNHDGEIQIVTSDRWLSNENAARLREAIGEQLGVVHLERLDCSTSFYRPKQRKAGTPPRIHPVVVRLRHASECSVRLSRAPLYPDTFNEAVAGGPSADTVAATLGQVASVRIAPWLGTAGIFLIDASDARALPAESLVPAVDTDDIQDGNLRAATRFAIRTTRGTSPPAAVLDHLERTLPRMCQRGRRSPLWLPPEGFDWFDLTQECLLIPRIAKTLRPVRVPAGVLPVNHNLCVVSAGGYSLDDIEAALARPSAMRWIEQRAPRLENGYYSIKTRMLRELPIG